MAKNRDLGDGTTTTKISNNKKGDRFLFVIGIDNYLHFNKLSNAVKYAKDFIEIMTLLSRLPITKLGVTSNGFLLEPFLPKLKEIECHHVNISLDTLSTDTFHKIARV